MRCVNPFISGKAAFGCGQCMPCRFNRRRVWAHRLMLEAVDYGHNCSFVTLTYAEQFAPRELVPEHFQKWLKRLRKRVSPRKIRFYGVGEYGERTWRPHYHAVLFGHPACYGSVRSDHREPCRCQACSIVRETWGYGHVMVGRLELKSAQYIAGYVTKKMTQRDDPRLLGRHPEFARMSLRPGIGADAMHDVASVMMQYKLECGGRDVPLALTHGGRELPLGRYLRAKLRVMCGLDEKSPHEALQEVEKKLSLVRRFAMEANRSVASVFQEINEPFERQLLAREIIKERGPL